MCTLTKCFMELVFSYSVSPQPNKAGSRTSYGGSGELSLDTLM